VIDRDLDHLVRRNGGPVRWGWGGLPRSARVPTLISPGSSSTIHDPKPSIAGRPLIRPGRLRMEQALRASCPASSSSVSRKTGYCPAGRPRTAPQREAESSIGWSCIRNPHLGGMGPELVEKSLRLLAAVRLVEGPRSGQEREGFSEWEQLHASTS
jgi:hypothetical protein